MDLLDKQEIIAELIIEGEKYEAIKKLTAWATETSYKDVIFEILEPMLVEWGKMWMQGKLSLAHGYLSGKVAEEFYMQASLNEEFSRSTFQKKGKIILGNIEDDFHPLGRRLVNIYSKATGWEIIDLGNDIPADHFIEKALEHHADIIAVSAMMFTTAKNIKKVRNKLDKRALSDSIKLAVGGAVFKLRPELVHEVGGDGTAETAIDAPALFDKLMSAKNSVLKNQIP